MEKSPRLYSELVQLCGQPGQWRDVRHLQTLAWMVGGLIQAECVKLTAWVPFVHSRARYAQSTQRRFRRWLGNRRIEVTPLYGPLIAQALQEWGTHTLYLALDTSLLWNQYCLVRLSVVYRGRAVPVVWEVMEHRSSSVTHAAYEALLETVPALLPAGVQVVFLADRGFADTELLAQLRRLGWHFRIRIKATFSVLRPGQPVCKVEDFSLAPGRALFLHNVAITAEYFGPVSLALARNSSSGEYWYIVSDEPTSVHTFTEYGHRFDIEENFLDDKSNGFQLESSLVRDAAALTRLCFVVAVATLYLVAQGTQVVAAQKRRWVDPHWLRGNSYLRIGWQWVKTALARGWELFATLHLSGTPDPEPCRASASQPTAPPAVTFTQTIYYPPSQNCQSSRYEKSRLVALS
jgi:Transposase DDE domain